MRSRFLVLFAGLAMMVACNKSVVEVGSSEYLFSESFVSCFFKIDSMMLVSESLPTDKEFSFIVQCGFENYYTKQHNEEAYQSYCELYGDTGFNSYLIIPNQASVNKIQYIKIFSDSDFPNHKAGESLNDLVNIRYETAKPFIDNNYPESWLGERPIKKDGYRVLAPGEGYVKVEKCVADLSPEELLLIDRNFHILFMEKPIENKDVTIYLELRDETQAIKTACRLNFYKDYRE